MTVPTTKDTMNDPTDTAPILAAAPLAQCPPPIAGAVGFTTLIVRMIQGESTLYGVTRDWHFDAATRKFVRLYALLEQQLPAIRLRMLRLAQQLPESAVGDWTAAREDAVRKPAAGDDGKLELEAVRQLLAAHQAVLFQLREEKARLGDGESKSQAATLVEQLVTDHEVDVFLLRALAWQVENTVQ